jgi:hypothetical protein
VLYLEWSRLISFEREEKRRGGQGKNLPFFALPTYGMGSPPWGYLTRSPVFAPVSGPHTARVFKSPSILWFLIDRTINEFRPQHSRDQMSVTSSPSTFVPPTFLNITAISAQNGVSVFECWQILPAFTTSTQAGTAGASILQLGNLANMSYSVLPPGFNAGLHNAPNTQCVYNPPSPLPLSAY